MRNETEKLKQFQELKNQIHNLPKSQEGQSAKNDPITRKILNIERELIAEEAFFEFKLSTLELYTPKEDGPLGNTGFKRSDYEVSWKKHEDQWSLFLTNIKHNHQKRLLMCPQAIREQVCELLPLFIQHFHGRLKALLKQES